MVGRAYDIGYLVGAVEEPFGVVDGCVSITRLDSVLLKNICFSLLVYPIVEDHGGLHFSEELISLYVIAALLVYWDGKFLLPLLGVGFDHVEVATAGAEDWVHVWRVTN